MAATYFHGGCGVSKKGEFILPPIITKARNLSDYGAAGVHRKDRVYVTTEYGAALLYAASVINGRVYVVEPIGQIEDDPDCVKKGLSYQCEKAKVIKIIKPKKEEIEMAINLLIESESV